VKKGEDEKKWKEVLYISTEALNKRIDLWNGITTKIKAKKETSMPV
jgi:hypothetical protein